MHCVKLSTTLLFVIVPLGCKEILKFLALRLNAQLIKIVALIRFVITQVFLLNLCHLIIQAKNVLICV